MKNRELLNLIVKAGSNKRQYLQALSQYVNNKNVILQEIAMMIAHQTSSEDNYTVTDDGRVLVNYDEYVLAEYKESTIKIPVKSVDGDETVNYAYVKMGELLMAAYPYAVDPLNSECTMHFNQLSAPFNINEHLNSYCLDDNVTITNPPSDGMINVYIPNQWMYNGTNTLNQPGSYSIRFDSVIRIKQNCTIVFSMDDVLDQFQHDINVNKSVVSIAETISKTDNVSLVDLTSMVTDTIGQNNFVMVKDDLDGLFNMAGDQLVDMEIRMSNVIEYLSKSTEDINIDTLNDDDYGITIDRGDYTGVPVSSMWNASTAAESLNKAWNITKKIISGVWTVVKAVFCALGRGIRRLWRKFITPLYNAKDFEVSNDNDAEDYCDIPILHVGSYGMGSDDTLVQYGSDAFASQIMNNLSEQTRYDYTFNKDSFEVIRNGLGKDITIVNKQKDYTMNYSLETIVDDEEVVSIGAKSSTFYFADGHLITTSRYNELVQEGYPFTRALSIRDTGVNNTERIYATGFKVIKPNMVITQQIFDGLSHVEMLRPTTCVDYRAKVLSDTSLRYEIRYSPMSGGGATGGCILTHNDPDIKFIAAEESSLVINGTEYSPHEIPSYWDDGTGLRITKYFLIRCKHIPSNMDCCFRVGFKVLGDMPRFSDSLGVRIDKGIELIYGFGDTTFTMMSGATLDFSVLPDVVMLSDPYSVLKVVDMPYVANYGSNNGYVMKLEGEGISIYTDDSSSPCYRVDWDGINGTFNLINKQLLTSFSLDFVGTRDAMSQLTINGMYRNGICYDLSYHPNEDCLYESGHPRCESVINYDSANNPISITMSIYSTPSMMLPATIESVIRDARNPIDEGFSTNLVYNFGRIALYNKGGGLGITMYPTAVPYELFFNSNGGFKYHLATDDSVSEFLEAISMIDSTPQDYTEDVNDQLAAKNLFASVYLMNLYLKLIMTLNNDVDDLDATNDPLNLRWDLLEKVLDDSDYKVSNQDLCDIIMVQINAELVMKTIYSLLYLILTMKPSFMKLYYLMHGEFPEFFPYIVGDRFGRPKYHIKTDGEHQKFIDNCIETLISAAIIAAAVVAAYVIVRKVKLGFKNKAKKAELDNHKLKGDYAKTQSDLDQINDQIKNGGLSGEALKDLKNQRNSLKKQLNKLSKKSIKNDRKMNRYLKWAGALGVGVPASMTKDTPKDPEETSDNDVDLTPINEQISSANTQIMDTVNDTNARVKEANLLQLASTAANMYTAIMGMVERSVPDISWHRDDDK